jgi:hypothetical protein
MHLSNTVKMSERASKSSLFMPDAYPSDIYVGVPSR